MIINRLSKDFCNGSYAGEKTYNSKCPKFSYTKVSDKIAYENSANPDQTAPSGAV